MTWRTFWRFTWAIALGGIIAELVVKAVWFLVILEYLP